MSDLKVAAVQVEKAKSAEPVTVPVEEEPVKTLYMFSDMEGCQTVNRDGTQNFNSIAMCKPGFYDILIKMMERDKGIHVAFLGDYFDQGLQVIPSLEGMRKLYNTYSDRVFIILGNRDINKLRFMYELTHNVISAPLFKDDDGNSAELPQVEPETYVNFKNGWNGWNPYYHGLHYKRITNPPKLDKVNMPQFKPNDEVALVKLILQTSMGATNKSDDKFVGLHSFIPPNEQNGKTDEDAVAYLKASFRIGATFNGGADLSARQRGLQYYQAFKEKQKAQEEEKQKAQGAARKAQEEKQKAQAQDAARNEQEKPVNAFDILEFYNKCKIAHVFDLGNGEKVLMAHGGGFNKGCFFNQKYVDSFEKKDDDSVNQVTPENYLQMMEDFRRKLSQPLPVGKMVEKENVEESVDAYNKLLSEVVTELTSKQDDAKYTWKFVLLQALGLKPDFEPSGQEKIYNSLVQSCSQNGSMGQSSYEQPNEESEESEISEYLKKSGITHVSYGHRPVCFPIPLMYSRANMKGIMFISNDTSNGNRRTEDLGEGETIVVGTKIDCFSESSGKESVASICYISIPGESSGNDEDKFNKKFKYFLKLKLTKYTAPKYELAANGVFQLKYNNGLVVSMNGIKTPFSKLTFVEPSDTSKGGRRRRTRRHRRALTKRLRHRSKGASSSRRKRVVRKTRK